MIKKESSEMKSKRIDYLDLAKGIGIILIIWGHAQNAENEPIAFFTAGMKIPVFFVISGILMTRSYSDALNGNISSYIVRRLKRLFIPYFFYSAVSILLYFAMRFHGNPDYTLEQVSKKIIDTVSLRGIFTLWFLPVMFVAELIVIMLHYLFKNLKVEATFTFIPSVLTCLFDKQIISEGGVLSLF